MIYAPAYDHTLQDDYFAAMSRVEQRLALAPKEEEPDGQVILEEERHQLLALTEQLAAPELSPQARLSLVAVLRVLLGGAIPLECIPASVNVNTPVLPP